MYKQRNCGAVNVACSYQYYVVDRVTVVSAHCDYFSDRNRLDDSFGHHVQLVDAVSVSFFLGHFSKHSVNLDDVV